ncbi:MAG: hypothetical protein K8R02_04635 [Anaerohalosphaeraceae bacterium]|nr:hypothetical protein [Anaerohalosphaeraceae bacterium]
MNKKVIIIAAAAGLIGFSGMFGFAFTTKKQPISDPNSINALADGSNQVNPVQMQLTGTGQIGQVTANKSLPEKYLKRLIEEVREKIQEYDDKLDELAIREQRIQSVQETFKSDIAELNDLRVELALTVATLKSEQKKLIESRLTIEKEEQSNLTSIAATYDKMDSTSAGKILMNMMQNKTHPEDPVKILFYMTERTKAKVLASIAETKPEVSAYLCQKLKQTKEL